LHNKGIKETAGQAACGSHTAGVLSLSRQSFQFWLEQDLPYVDEYQCARDILADKLRGDDAFEDLLPEIDATWRTLPGVQETSFEIEMLQLIGVRPAEVTFLSARRSREGYINHLRLAALAGNIADLAAAMLPCELGFTEMAQRVNAVRSPELDSIYSKWLDYYLTDEQQRNTDVSVLVLERAAESLTAEEREHCQQVFLRSVQHQILVLDAAWRASDPWPGDAPDNGT
jgi:thiaminase/transcriptional activator TenA